MAVEENVKSKKGFFCKIEKNFKDSKYIVILDTEVCFLPGKCTLFWALLHIKVLINIFN